MVSISLAVSDVPSPRLAVPSYLWANTLRCQAYKIFGVTSVATSLRSFRPKPLALEAN